MSRCLLLLVALFSLQSCYDSFPPAGGELDHTESPNTTIVHLHTLYAVGTREVNQDLIVRGQVTANDEWENFYKTFVIESDGYAIEILDGLFNSYVRHPLGSEVTLKLNGLKMDRYRGLLRVGLPAPLTSSFALEYMSAEAIVDKYVTLTGFGHMPIAKNSRVDDLREEQAGEFISIDDLKLSTTDGIERTWSGYSLFLTSAQDSIWCYTSPYSSFAGEMIPPCRVTLQGILEYGNTESETNQFMIKLRGAQDCIY